MKKFTFEIKAEKNGTINFKFQPVEERFKEINAYMKNPSEETRPYVLIGEFEDREMAVEVAQKAFGFRKKVI